MRIQTAITVSLALGGLTAGCPTAEVSGGDCPPEPFSLEETLPLSQIEDDLQRTVGFEEALSGEDCGALFRGAAAGVLAPPPCPPEGTG